MLRERKILKRPFIHCVLLGETGSGKSSLINKLIGARQNTESLEDCSGRHHMVRVCGSEWEAVDYDDEAHSLFQDDPNIQFLCDQLSYTVGEGLRVPKTASFQSSAPTLKPPLEIVRSALSKNIASASEKNSFTVYITDSGGQPEFQELLPAIFSGLSIFFLCFHLGKDISKNYSSGGGISSFQCHASSTNGHLLRTLATIATFSEANRLSVRPQVFLVGTHQDSVSEEEFSRIDYELQQLIRPTLLYQTGLVQCASENRLIMEFNSSLPMSSAVTQIHSVVECLSVQKDFNCSVPRSWLMLDLILRQSKLPILSFDECFGVAQDCGIDTRDELQEALLFLSERIGSVKYVNHDDIKCAVITDLRYTFEIITNLYHRSPPADAVITKKGIITLDSLQKLLPTEKLNPSMLIRIIESLHLANRIPVEGDSAAEYFIPCSLPWTSLEGAPERQESRNAPLMIHFDCGYIPAGFFGGLVAHLIGNSERSSLDWKLADEQAFRNRIKFWVRLLLETVTLVMHFSDIEVNITSSFSKSHDLSNKSLFIEVRRCLEKCCDAALQKLNFRDTYQYSFGFSCPDIGMEPGSTPHAALVKFHQGQVEKLVCPLTQRVWDAPLQCKLWFGQVRLAVFLIVTCAMYDSTASGGSYAGFCVLCKEGYAVEYLKHNWLCT